MDITKKKKNYNLKKKKIPKFSKSPEKMYDGF